MKKNGYTLIEVLAAVSIFFIASTALLTFFMNAVKAQRTALSSQELVDNISYSMEYMSRALRMAKKDDVNGINCLSGNKVNYEVTRGGFGIKFRTYDDHCQEFFLETDPVSGIKRLKEWKDVDGGSSNYLTSENMEITDFTIGPIDSWDQNDNEQSKVTIFLKAVGLNSADSDSPTTLEIQTTVSQRNLDVRY